MPKQCKRNLISIRSICIPAVITAQHNRFYAPATFDSLFSPAGKDKKKQCTPRSHAEWPHFPLFFEKISRLEQKILRDSTAFIHSFIYFSSLKDI